MDINKTYRNAKLESRRQELIRTAIAEAALRQRKLRGYKPRAEVLAAMRGERAGSLSSAILELPGIKNAVRRREAAPQERFLLAVVDQSRLLEEDCFRKYLPTLGRLLNFRSQWLRDPVAWRPNTHNVERQFASLARHLLVRFHVPCFFDRVWFSGDPVRQAWFAHIGQGGNLRKAAGLPIALTKMMAHFAMTGAPEGANLEQALRYGQARGVGVDELLTRAVLGSRIGNEFFNAEQEAFWASVLGFVAQHLMIDPHQVGPIFDYLNNQKFVAAPPLLVNGTYVNQPPPQPGLSMRGRDPEALVAQVEAWHRRLRRRAGGRYFEWRSCGIRGYDRVEGESPNQRQFTITELLNTAELRVEGTAMRHCVATYGSSCQSGRAAIYSMKVLGRQGEQRLVTIEVDVRNRLIVQARTRFNAASTPMHQRIMQAWATVADLKFGHFALTRAG